MSRVAKYTNEQIKEEIYKMIANGNLKPTVVDVRNQLGGGSLSTISPILKEVLAEINSANAQVSDLPEPLKEQILRTVAPIWKYAEELSMAKVASIESQRKEDRAILQAENSELLAHMDKQDKEYEILQEKNDASRVQIDRGQQEKIDLQDMLHDLEKSKLAIEVQHLEQNKQLEELRMEVVSLRASNAELQKELIDLVKRQK